MRSERKILRRGRRYAGVYRFSVTTPWFPNGHVPRLGHFRGNKSADSAQYGRDKFLIGLQRSNVNPNSRGYEVSLSMITEKTVSMVGLRSTLKHGTEIHRRSPA